jgi:Glycosyltransferase family 87
MSASAALITKGATLSGPPTRTRAWCLRRLSSRTVDTTSGAAAAQAGGRTGPGPAAGAGHPAEDGQPTEAGHADGAGHAALPGRRAVTVWFAVFTVYAGAEIFTRHADGTWGAWACGGYALATILLLTTRSWLLPLGAAFIGAFLAPLTWMILKLPTTSTAEVVVINRSADYLAAHGTPYLPASLITGWQSYNPYLPLMELFGLPREAGAPGLLGDPRLWTSLLTLAALAAAFALLSPHPVRGCRSCKNGLVALTAFAVASPLIALPLTAGVTDPPIIGLTVLALALAHRGRFLSAALVLAVACAMKPTAWAAIPVLAVLAWVRASHRTAVAFTATVAAATVALALAAAPNVLATPDAIRQNLVDYPLGTSKYKTVADSPLPGYLIAHHVPGGHLVVDALLLLTFIGFVAWLVARPPRDMRDAAVRLIVLYAVLFTLAPSSRFGYYTYPLALAAWLALSKPGPTMLPRRVSTMLSKTVSALRR